MIAARNEQQGDEMVRSLGPSSRFVRTDVSLEPDIKRAIDATVETFGRLDCLFNNAGGPTPGTVDTVTPENFAYAMNLLLGSVVFGMRYAAPVMKAQGRGAVINNGSVAAGHTHLGQYLYSIAKAGVVHATRMAGMELGPFGISVNSISPGAIATPIFFGGSAAFASLDPEHARAKLAKLTGNLAKATPLRRSGLPHNIAAAVLFLASDEGAFVNCHDFVVDGGMSAGGQRIMSDRWSRAAPLPAPINGTFGWAAVPRGHLRGPI
jgi:NAD(P)-dependent dehydrogenase (short-subunit alcohol dehydrogenase family)